MFQNAIAACALTCLGTFAAAQQASDFVGRFLTYEELDTFIETCIGCKIEGRYTAEGNPMTIVFSNERFDYENYSARTLEWDSRYYILSREGNAFCATDIDAFLEGVTRTWCYGIKATQAADSQSFFSELVELRDGSFQPTAFATNLPMRACVFYQSC